MRNEPSVSPSSPMCFAPQKFALSTHRRGLTVVLALAYLMAMVGSPWPTSSATPGVTPFPCQGHRCGCQSAQQCWANCCCFTPQQRLAWAREHLVEPPAELVAAVADHEEHPAADDHRAGHSCCHKNAGACAVATSHGPLKDKKNDGPGFHAFKCHGIATLWVTTGAVAPSIIPPAWTFDWNVVGTVPTPRFSLSAVTFLPAVPPPRASGRLARIGAV
jgi:hypothetical protein